MKNRIVLLGPPASGKGTQADFINTNYGIPVASPGAIFREEKRLGSELGRTANLLTEKGRLVPDEMVVDVVKAWVGRSKGVFVFDGFPRTIGQATMTEEFLNAMGFPLQLVIGFQADTAMLERRVANRLVCSQCARSFSLGVHMQSVADNCPKCAGGLIRRNDDSVESLACRLTEYREKTEPLWAFYQMRGILRTVDAADCPEAVFASLKKLIEAT